MNNRFSSIVFCNPEVFSSLVFPSCIAQVDENSGTGKLVGRLTCIDPDKKTETCTFVMTADAGGRFRLNGQNVEVGDCFSF